MNVSQREIWFWQQMVTPHMAELAAELARKGCDVTYVAESLMTKERTKQGWIPPDLEDAKLELMDSVGKVISLVEGASLASIHICQGIRSNGLVRHAQRALARRGVCQWIVMETVDDSGWKGILKRLEYWRQFYIWKNKIEGVLALGEKTPEWVVARGVPVSKVYPFAYFLSVKHVPVKQTETSLFRFVFVGRLIQLKRVDFLIRTLALLTENDFDLLVIGSGPEENALKELADKLLPGRVIWTGGLELKEVPMRVANTDCLVLPSIHDGWGAVVSEALMVGTPAICSDQCGSSVVVKFSGYGGVFSVDDEADFTELLQKSLKKGRLPISERKSLASWAEALAVGSGAEYLMSIMNYKEGMSEKPRPPWESSSHDT